MGMGGNENSTFSHFQWKEEKQPISGATSASPGTPADINTLDCHSPLAKKRRVFDYNDLCDAEDEQQQSRKYNWQYWEWKELGTNNGTEIGNGNVNEPLKVGGNGIVKDFPAHL